MQTVHLNDLEGGMTAARAALVTELRTYGAEFTQGVYAESRAVTDEINAMEYLAKTSAEFSVFVFAEDPDLVYDPTDQSGRIYRPSFVLLFIQKYSDGAGEDRFLDSVERVVLRLGSQEYLGVDVDGLTIAFQITEITGVLPVTVVLGPNDEALGHAAIRRIILEVNACAS